jgi:hypothetical protein
MQALKSFIDSQGRRLRPGDTLPGDYDGPTLKHYARHGMVGEPQKSVKSEKPARATRLPAPAVTKPAAPSYPMPAESKPLAPLLPGPEEIKPADPEIPPAQPDAPVPAQA